MTRQQQSARIARPADRRLQGGGTTAGVNSGARLSPERRARSNMRRDVDSGRRAGGSAHGQVPSVRRDAALFRRNGARECGERKRASGQRAQQAALSRQRTVAATGVESHTVPARKNARGRAQVRLAQSIGRTPHYFGGTMRLHTEPAYKTARAGAQNHLAHSIGHEDHSHITPESQRPGRFQLQTGDGSERLLARCC